MPTPLTCPALEDLAAFVEGALAGEARDGMLRHLDACPRCRALYVEAARMQEELGPTGIAGIPGAADPTAPARTQAPAGAAAPPAAPRNPAPPSPPAGRPLPRRRRFLAVAVAAGVAMAAGIGFFLWQAPPLGASAYQIASAFSKPATDLMAFIAFPDASRGPRERGLDEDRGLFHLGTRLIDLTLAGEAGDPEQIGPAAWGVYELAGLATKDAASPYARLAKRMEDRDPPPTPPSAAELERLERGLHLDTDPFLALGRWTEATRIAVAAGDRAYFDDAEIRRLPHELRRQQVAPLPPEVERALDEAESLLAGPFEGRRAEWERVLAAIRGAFPLPPVG